MTRKDRLLQRDQQVKKYFDELEKKNPQWKLSALLENTAERFPPIAASTVSAIIKGTGKYSSKN